MQSGNLCTDNYKSKMLINWEKIVEDGLQTAVSYSQNGILYVKINKHIHVICMQICFWLKNWLN